MAIKKELVGGAVEITFNGKELALLVNEGTVVINTGLFTPEDVEEAAVTFAPEDLEIVYPLLSRLMIQFDRTEYLM
jgi:hypothetical protein